MNSAIATFRRSVDQVPNRLNFNDHNLANTLHWQMEVLDSKDNCENENLKLMVGCFSQHWCWKVLLDNGGNAIPDTG